jgi:hypothetical protein
MRKVVARGLAALAFLPTALGAQVPCAVRAVPVPGTQIELLPLAGFVEVCGQDTTLCRQLTAGYPPTTTTLGYFVPEQEWRAHRRGTLRGFTQYLIAQGAGSLSPSGFPAFKRQIHTQQGQIPDHSRLPALVESGGRVALGVFDESENSISFGVVMAMRPAGSDESAAIRMVATNSALVLGQRVLSLYVYRRFRAAADVEGAEEQTKAWLGCLRKAN